MKNEMIMIPETHIECEFCKPLGINYYCTAVSSEKILLENPGEKINLSICPMWGRIKEKERTN